MKKVLALLIAAAMIMAAAACSPGSGSNSSGSDAGTNTDSPAQTTNNDPAPAADNPASNEPAAPAPKVYSQGVTDTSVKIANSAATSGAYAAVGVPFLAGMNAYFDMVNNELGGIEGRQIDFIHEDDGFDPVVGKAALEKFISDEKVFALVGHFGTPIVAATLEDIKEAGIPAVYFATGIPQLFNAHATGDERWIMPVQPIYTSEGEVMVAYAKGYFQAAKIGIIYSNDDAGKAMYDGVTRKASEMGLEVVAQEIQAGATDATAQVAKVKDCDLIIAAAIQATFPVIVKEMEKQDVIKPVITTYVNVSATQTSSNAEFIPNLIHTESAGIYGLGWVNAGEEFVTNDPDYLKYVSQMEKTGQTENLNTYAMTGWIAASFFCEGLRRLEGQDITWENYLNAMESSPIKNPFGGYIDFSDGKRYGTQSTNLSRMDDADPSGWQLILPIRSMEEILAGLN